MSEDDQIGAKRRSIQKRVKHNRKMLAYWLVYIAVLVVLFSLVARLFPDTDGWPTIAGILAFMVGTVLILRRLQAIMYEERAIGSITSALSALEKYEREKDSEQLELASKKMRVAADRFSKFDPQSSIYMEALGIRAEIRNALKKKLPYLAKQTNGLLLVKQELFHLRSILFNPNLESLKTWTEEVAKFPEEPRPPPREINWNQFVEGRLGQVVISVVVSIVSPPLLILLYALMAHLDGLTIIQENLGVLVIATFATLVGLLNWLGHK